MVTNNAEKGTPVAHESPRASSHEYVEDTTALEVDNYHGLTLRTTLVYVALCLQYFVQMFNVVGSGAFSRSIAASVGGSDKTVWLSQAIVIVTVVLGPPASQAADYWGRKVFLVFGSAIGLIGALILSRADTMGQAIAGQVVLGVLYIAQPILIAVGSEILPRRLRPLAQAGLNAGGALGAVTGLLAGSALTANSLFGWRSYWYIIAALLGTSAATLVFLYRPLPRSLQQTLPFREKLARLDWIAYSLLPSGLTLFTMGLSWGDNPFPWTDAHVLGPLILGGGLFLALIAHQTFVKKDGLVHHDLFKKDRNFALALGCFFADGMIFWSANNYYAFQVSVLYEDDTLLVNLHFCIAFFTGVIAAIMVGVISTFTKSIREPIVASFLFLTLFFALMATTTLSSANAVWGYPVLLGIGLGWSLTYLITAAQLSAPPELIAITSGILLSIRSLGGSIGLAIYTAIFNSSISTKISSEVPAAVIPLGLPPQSVGAFIGALSANDEAAFSEIPGVTPEIIASGIHALQEAYLQSFHRVWTAAAVLSGVTVLVSCFFINPVGDLNNHVDAPLEED
ncbi:uncharacterized protein HMPREF1541_01467 [Cyphellophora europaea CBS 101466]|uniref:Major facilitator superfamily (MFS) profile domain-containing protein n=1 Tax=Cyphellophora europaea (strain CBS 101466) TaxID=1220924 RepID=W2S2N8_CYPE1|nr:uncharacterized protein HMPREF1541_01467 [Cyphellophora europaea CBS 101466]ETN42313.1 hypothetical protein HMPREF1541_01467 [Cyphellophora europaea CBS 101466]